MCVGDLNMSAPATTTTTSFSLVNLVSETGTSITHSKPRSKPEPRIVTVVPGGPLVGSIDSITGKLLSISRPAHTVAICSDGGHSSVPDLPAISIDLPAGQSYVRPLICSLNCGSAAVPGKKTSKQPRFEPTWPV